MQRLAKNVSTKNLFCYTVFTGLLNKRGVFVDAKMLREFFALGVVSKFTVQPEPMSSGWYLVACVKGVERALETARGGVRVFSSLDTLVSQVEGITGRKPAALSISV